MHGEMHAQYYIRRKLIYSFPGLDRRLCYWTPSSVSTGQALYWTAHIGPLRNAFP